MQMLQATLILICFLVLFVYPSFSVSVSTSAKQCNPDDEKVLLQIKAHFGGHKHTVFNNWDPKTTACCTWFGVQCDAYAHNRVTSLNISLEVTNNIQYVIPPAIGYLPFLHSLNLSYFNMLTGPIPSTLARLTNLRALDLNGNNLDGPIPAFLGLQLKKLTYVDLSTNNLRGPIPATLGHLTGLTHLDLDVNELTGPIPSSFSHLNNLEYLNVFDNKLSGPIPPFFSHLTKLNFLSLGSNKFTGPIPASFGSFNNPQMRLDLSDNRLSGPIPRSLGQANLLELTISINKLVGDASFLFGRNKTALEVLYLHSNQLSFNFSNVDFPQGLKVLFIADNQIYGTIPRQVGQLPLQYFDVSYNQLCGPIPTGRRLKQFGLDRFSHNKCLCGAPLPPCK